MEKIVFKTSLWEEDNIEDILNGMDALARAYTEKYQGICKSFSMISKV